MNSLLIRRGTAVLGATLLALPMALITAAEAATPRCFGRRATIVGTRRADDITGTRRADVIVAKGGADIIVGRGGNDRICAGKGLDQVTGGGGNDRINAGGGSDLIAGQGGGDILLGRGGSDGVFGGAGDDVLKLGPGAFQFALPGAGDDQVRGNAATLDFVSYLDAAAGVTVDLSQGMATGAGTDVLIDVDGAEGSLLNDTLIGTAGSNFLFGLDGDDTITSGGNNGDLTSPETIVDLRFDFLGGDAGNDTITGGAGLNVLAFDLAQNGVDVDLQTGQSTGEGTDTLSGIQGVIGSRFADTLRGDNADNLFEPEAGADTFDGRAGSDTLVLLDAVSGNVDLGANTATTIYRPFDPATGTQGQPVTSTVTLAGVENAWGSGGNDVLRGDGTANRLFGFLGSDQLFGLAGDDFLDGGPDLGTAATNTLDGGDGTDTCVNGTPTNCEPPQRTTTMSGYRTAWGRSIAVARLSLLRAFGR